jgi:hypothetical protein
MPDSAFGTGRLRRAFDITDDPDGVRVGAPCRRRACLALLSGENASCRTNLSR